LFELAEVEAKARVGGAALAVTTVAAAKAQRATANNSEARRDISRSLPVIGRPPYQSLGALCSKIDQRA
jgi:hypothetical protein